MSWIEPTAIGVLAAVLLFETLLLIGMKGLLQDQNRKTGILLANYKADLEMVMLHAHNFDEFIKQTEEAMKGEEKPNPDETFYIK